LNFVIWHHQSLLVFAVELFKLEFLYHSLDPEP